MTPGAQSRNSPEVSSGGGERKQALSLSVIVPVYNERYLVEASLKRLLAVRSPLISSMEVIVVDDRSTDGSWEVLEKLARENPGIRILRHVKNSGKGAAIRTALVEARNEVTIIHDADLEYHPEDIPSLLEVFVSEGADAVFGSRYLPSRYRRVLLYRHSLINKAVTAVVNLLTDLDLTDVETCYKAIKTDLLKSIPIRSKDFRFEVEITMKLARRKANVFEAPIRYVPRTYEEGKKIRMRDGFLALLAALRFTLVEDLYHQEHYGLHVLMDMNNARRFNQWMARTIIPYLGDRVLEIGAGIGNLTGFFIPRNFYVASDMNPDALRHLKSFAIGRPYVSVQKIDAERSEDFENLKGSGIDTVVMLNVLEHVADERQSLRNIHGVLSPGGRAIILVPQDPGLYGSFDENLGHRERYTREKLERSLRETGFEIERVFDFNRASVPSWWLNGKVLKRKRFSRFQLKMLELLMPVIKRVDRFLPWRGLSLIAVAKKGVSSS